MEMEMENLMQKEIKRQFYSMACLDKRELNSIKPRADKARIYSIRPVQIMLGISKTKHL